MFRYQGNMKQHMLTHKIRDMPPGFDKGISGSTGPPSEEGRDPSPERRSSPEKMDLKRSPPALPPPQMTHPPPIDMPPLPKRPTGMYFPNKIINQFKAFCIYYLLHRTWLTTPI